MTLQEYFLESEKRRPEKAVKTYPKVPAQSAEWHKSRNGALNRCDTRQPPKGLVAMRKGSQLGSTGILCGNQWKRLSVLSRTEGHSRRDGSGIAVSGGS